MDGHLAAGQQPRIDTDARPLGLGQVEDAARRRQVIVVRVLSVEPALDRVSAGDDLLLGQGSGRPAATSSWRRTRSRPVTASVTGCSTWSRVFISRK